MELADKKLYLNEVPIEKLTKLLTVMESQIKIGMEILRGITEMNQEVLNSLNSDEKTTVEISARCVALSLRVMSGNGMSRDILIEESFESCLEFSKTILRKYIYPCVESEDTKKKTKKKSAFTNFIIQITDIFKRVNKLIRKQKLKDEFILTISDITVSTFFVNNIEDIQLAALGIITKVGQHIGHI